MTQRETEIRARAGEPRCDVCLLGPVQAVCSRCRGRLCRAHDAILDPVGGLPFGRAARVRRTAWAASPLPDSGRTPASRTRKGSTAAPVDDIDEDDDPGDETRSTAAREAAREGGAASRADHRIPTNTGLKTDASRDWFSLPGAESTAPAPTWEAADRQARPEDRHLCPRCLPLDRWCDAELMAAGMTGALAAGALAFSFVLPAAVLGAVALGRIGARLARARTSDRRRRRLPNFVAADPHVRKVRLTETVETRARLYPDQRYETSDTTVHGEVRLDASWTRSGGGAALAKAAAAKVDTVAAGHVVLQGPGALRLELSPGQVVTGNDVVSLMPSRTDSAQGLPSSESPTGPWPVTVRYIPEPDRAARTEVWVTPTIGPESGRRTLELDISWRTRGEERYETGLALKKLDLVRVELPENWGRIERPSHPEIATIGRGDSGARVVEWKDVRVEPENLRGVDVRFRKRGPDEDKKLVDGFTAGRTYGTIPLAVRMADTIPPDAELTARVEARFAGAVSGLTGVAVHYAGGGQRPEGRRPTTVGPGEPPLAEGPRDATGPWNASGYRNAAPITRVLLDLDLSLAGARYQAMRSVPDRAEGESDQDTTEFPATIPDHDTVALLVDRLSESGYYVKRTVENRPQVGRTSATLTRSWDIGGRYYFGVYPVDFDIQVTGEEPVVPGAAAGVTRVKLHVRGAHATTEMHDRVVDEHRNLWGVLRGVLEAPRPSSPQEDDPEATGTIVSDVRALLRRATRHGRISAASERELVEHVDTAFTRGDGS